MSRDKVFDNNRPVGVARMTSRLGPALALTTLIAACSGTPAPFSFPQVAAAPRPLPGMDLAEVPWLSPTHFGFFEDLEVITNWSSGQLLFRRVGSRDPWQESTLALRRPHSFATGANGHLYIADTHNNRIVEITHPAAEEFRQARQISGQRLRKPHDIAADPATGDLWVLDNRRLCRFRTFGTGESCLRLSTLGVSYARGLSIVDSKVYLAASSQGKVVCIEDFDRKLWAVIESPGKQAVEPAGSWETTGLVLNDIEYFDGFWYGSNFFHADFANGTNSDSLRLIRWRTWADFQVGRWQDLSSLVPSGLVPYFFTVAHDQLWVAAHSAALDHQGWIYHIAERRR